MKFKIPFLLLVITSLSLSSCYKEGNNLDEYDITVTHYEKDFDFSTYSSFIVRDSVMLYSDYLEESEIHKFYSNGTSNSIRKTIINKFKSLGYTEATNLDDADFVVNPIISLMQEEGLIYNWWWSYPGYWGYYYDWWWYYKKGTDYYYYPPYWGWYPPTYTYYSYKTGSLVMEMVDAKSIRDSRDYMENTDPADVDPNEIPEIYFRWTALIDGILGSSGSYNTDRAERGFNEAFEQSPYLNKQ